MIKRLLFNIFFTATITLLIGSVSAQCTLSIVDIVESNAISCNGSCDGELGVSFSGEVGTVSFQWLDGSMVDLGVNNSTITGLCTGTYSVFITDNNNCTADTTITISEPAVITSTTSRTNTTCATSVGELDVTGTGGCGGPYQYAIDGGALQASGTFSGLAVGFYTITVQDNCGCSQNFTEYVSSTDGPTIVNLNFINPLCSGGNNGSITIFAIGTPALSYSIDGGTTFTGNNVYTNLAPGGYSVVVEDGSGCQSLGYLTITEPSAIVASPVSINETCVLNNGSINLPSSGGTGNYQYSIDNGTSFQASSSFTGLIAGTYDYIVEDDNACQATGQLMLTTGAGPTITSSSFLNPICSNNCNGTITISALGNAPISFSSNGGTGQTTGDFTNLCSGNYTIDITDADGCSTSQNFVLTAPNPPVASFTVSDTSGLAPLTVTFTNTSTGATSYSWDLGDTATTSSAMDTTFEYTGEGVYTVMMIASELQCTDTAYQVISIIGTPNISMPNVFTPNNDGINDVFRPIAVGASEIVGKIYNRWGELIYEWWGINGYWDGYTRPAGQLVPEGTYFFVVTGTDIAGITYELTGTVQLMR